MDNPAKIARHARANSDNAKMVRELRKQIHAHPRVESLRDLPYAFLARLVTPANYGGTIIGAIKARYVAHRRINALRHILAQLEKLQ